MKIFDDEGKVCEASKNPLSLIGIELSPDKIPKIWNEISEYITYSLYVGQGVRIHGLATITFRQDKYLIPNKLHIKKIPYIVLAKTLVIKYNLDEKRPPFERLIPVEKKLNVSAIAMRVGATKSEVEIAIQEVVQAFQRAITQDCHVVFEFPKIGKITVKCRKVSSCFQKSLIDCLSFGWDRETILKKCPYYTNFPIPTD